MEEMVTMIKASLRKHVGSIEILYSSIKLGEVIGQGQMHSFRLAIMFNTLFYVYNLEQAILGKCSKEGMILTAERN